LHHLRNHLAHLGRGTIDLTPSTTWPTGNLLRLITEGLSVGIVVAGDVDLNNALDRIVKEQSEQTKEIERLEGKLGNQDFTAKAPPEVITDHQDRLTSLRRDHAMLVSSGQQLRAMLGE
jgi:valyl-tRNA synthetase